MHTTGDQDTRPPLPHLHPVEPARVYPGNHGNHPVIEVSDRVPGERARMVVQGRRTDDNSACTVIVIHERTGTWAIHGLGNQGVRLSPADIAALAEAILTRTR